MTQAFRERITPREARTFVLASIIGATQAWDIAFNFGAFGTIFYTKLFFIWSASIALFGVSLVLPERLSPVTWWGRIILVLPTLWLLVALVEALSGGQTVGIVTELVGISIFALCLPYAFWLVAEITQPEFFRVQSRSLIIGIVAIIILVAGLGYLAGHNHFLLLSCDDFALAGSFVPDNCYNPN